VPGSNCPIKAIVLEAIAVIVTGAVAGLAANQISPRGLALSRNYFPAGTNAVAVAPTPMTIASNSAPTNAVSDPLAERLRSKGLQGMNRNEVEKLLHDPGASDGHIVLIDARDDEHYEAGHIPGAYELDPYHPDDYLPAVLPVCQAAEKIIVYCAGGECEDSDTAAILLRDAGIPNTKLFVFTGGYTEWNDHHLPLEMGERTNAPPENGK
jgi:rhodanese-related sulfurtransferase